jgi:hypothetical protein
VDEGIFGWWWAGGNGGCANGLLPRNLRFSPEKRRFLVEVPKICAFAHLVLASNSRGPGLLRFLLGHPVWLGYAPTWLPLRNLESRHAYPHR